MLTVIPPTAYGRLGALLSALIVVCALISLTLHRDVYHHTPRPDFYSYYTNVSTVIVLVYFSIGAPLLYAKAPLRRFIPVVEFSIAMMIMLTHIVFHNLLFPALRKVVRDAEPSCDLSMLIVNNLFIHYLVPWLTFAYWLLCSPHKDVVTLPGTLVWLLVPLTYLYSVFRRARYGNIAGTDSPYPYPFLDAKQYGVKRVLLICLGLLALCILASLAVYAAVQLLYAYFGGGHALILI